MAQKAKKPKAKLSPRGKVLKTLDPSHRWIQVRRVTQSLTLLALFAVPLSGLARFDAFGGEHYALFQPASWVEGIGIVGAGIIGFYAITFVVNWGFGRLFCGFGCPVGQVSRFGDQLDVALRTGKNKLAAWAQAWAYALVLSFSILLWWVSPKVFWQGSFTQVAAAGGVWIGVAGLAILHARFWRWGFCRKWCPIGLYYTFVQLPHSFGIKFNEVECEDCKLCILACPVSLDPTNLETRIDGAGGLAFDGFPARNYCLTCGDCVRACEHAMGKREQVPALVLGFGHGAKTGEPAGRG